MNQPQTDLEAQRQNQEVETQAQAAIPTPLQDNGSTVPPVYATMDLKGKAPANPFQPPSTGEIHQQMWIGSFMLALMAGLASGNPAAAIVGGMWGAIGIHDYGNTLQQRAQWTEKLQKDGYSIPAIMKWYEDGDASELDKERSAMQQDKRMAQQDAQFDERMKQEDKRFDQQDRHFNEQMALQRDRMAQSDRLAQQRFGLMAQKLGAVNGWANLGHMNSLAGGIYRPLKERVVNLNNKQNYVDQLNTALAQMKDGNPVSFNAVLTGLAGMDNPNAVPKEGAIERLEDVGGLSQNLRNRLARVKNGVFDAETINDLQQFAAAHQADIDEQRQKIFDHAAQTAAGELKAAGVNDQGNQAAASIAQQVANGDIADNPLAAQLPALATDAQQAATAEQKQQSEPPKDGSEHVSAGGVKFTVTKS